MCLDILRPVSRHTLKCFIVLYPTPSPSQERVFLERESHGHMGGNKFLDHSDPVGTSLQLTDCDRMTFKSAVTEWWRKTWPSGCSVVVAAAASHSIMEVCFASERKDTGRCLGRCALVTTSSHSAAAGCMRSSVKTKLHAGTVLVMQGSYGVLLPYSEHQSKYNLSMQKM